MEPGSSASKFHNTLTGLPFIKVKIIGGGWGGGNLTQSLSGPIPTIFTAQLLQLQ